MMDDELMIPVVGKDADDLVRAWKRYVESGYDRRLWPEAPARPERQAMYDAFDRGDWVPEIRTDLEPEPDFDAV